MATTTASKPRSARAAATEAASISQATAARKRTSGNASGERVTKGAQARRRARAAEAATNGSSASSNGRSTKATAATGNGRASKAGTGNGNGRPSAKSGSAKSGSANTSGTAKTGSAKSGSPKRSSGSSSSSKPAPKTTNGRAKTAASKPKAAAPKPKGSASKPKAAAPKPKGSASKPKAAAPKPKGSASKPKAGAGKDRSAASLRKGSGSSRSASGQRSTRSDDGNDQHNHSKDGENPVTSGGKHLASALFSSTSHRPKKHPVARAVAKRAAKKGLKAVGRRSLNAGGEALRSVAENAGSLSRQAMRAGMARVVDNRPPVQASVDVAAPISVVWSEWMTFEWFTEGLHNIDEVERDGDELFGRVVAPHERDWHAEIVDEREEQAFAWRSDDGTDCAGLVTFHRLSDRLTRVEADLDVLPTNPGETFLLSLPIPARRAERVLQLFKAHVEFINPDVYEEEDSEESDSDQQDDARAESDGDSQTQEDNDGDREDAENDENDD